jgi:hypothetical protein
MLQARLQAIGFALYFGEEERYLKLPVLSGPTPWCYTTTRRIYARCTAGGTPHRRG